MHAIPSNTQRVVLRRGTAATAKSHEDQHGSDIMTTCEAYEGTSSPLFVTWNGQRLHTCVLQKIRATCMATN